MKCGDWAATPPWSRAICLLQITESVLNHKSQTLLNFIQSKITLNWIWPSQITANTFVTKHRNLFCFFTNHRLPCLIAHRWEGHQTQWWPRHKAIYLSWLGPELFCLLLDPPGFNCWLSFAPVLQWCCSTPQGSPGVGRNTLFLSSPHLCFIIVFFCDLFV